MKTFTLQLGEIPVEATDSDSVLLAKAQSHLPQALQRLGEKAGQEAWVAMERETSDSPIQFEDSNAEKAEFIRETAEEFARNANDADKKDLIETIFKQLQEERNTKAMTTPPL